MTPTRRKKFLRELEQSLENVEWFIDKSDLSDSELADQHNLTLRFRYSASELRHFQQQLISVLAFLRERLAAGDEAAIDALIDTYALGRIEGLHQFRRFGPEIERGFKQIRTGQKAARKTHGTREEVRARYAKWQAFMDEEYRFDPTLTRGTLIRSTAAKFRVGYSTVEHNTVNPRKNKPPN